MSQSNESPSLAVTGGGSREIMLFGVRLNADALRKTVSINNLSDYESVPGTNDLSTNHTDELMKVDDAGSAAGYASADDVTPLPSSGSRGRKRGLPWTEEEHKLFLLGLSKVGKGDWKGIARKYVKTRTSTQVASHAQKYFLRRGSANGRRRRASLFDITTDTVNQMPVQEVKNNLQRPLSFPVMSTMQRGSPIVRSDRVNVPSPTLIHPAPVHAVPSRMLIDLNSNQQVPLPLNLSLMSAF